VSLRAKLKMAQGVLRGLRRRDLDPDPIAQFGRWFKSANRSGLHLPEAFCLATTAADGRPSARMLLLKGFDAQGFVFFTNYDSRKANEIALNPRAAMTFHWSELQRQGRIEGAIGKVSAAESLAYFRSRPRGSQIGAWASRQSAGIPDRAFLEAAYREVRDKHRGQEIPLPTRWGGFRLAPESIEFWQGRADRLHDRFLYVRAGSAWTIQRLSP
jgi:pyridoxamine 5'-phosphate oxidase